MRDRAFANPQSPVQTVDELSNAIKAVVTGSSLLRNVAVRGEIQNFKRHGSGHVYFTVAGNESKIASVLFRSYASVVTAWPQDGDEALVTGSVDVYPKGGTYQLYATYIMPIGLGAQQRAKEALRTALDREGLFDIRHKRPLPKYPSKVAVITSPTGAALRDILEVSSNRAPFIDIVLIPAAVQGFEAPAQVTRALSMAGTLKGVNCVVLARGGGAKDDLSPFDDERIVRAVRSCPIPVVTGVGHQIDSSLADLAADIALPTPSAAAETVFPDIRETLGILSSSQDIIRSASLRRLEMSAASAEKNREKLLRNMNLILSERENYLRIGSSEIKRRFVNSIERRESFLSQAASTLDALSPLAVLARGFSICRDVNGRAVKNSSSVKTGDRVSIRFHTGSAEADIASVTAGGA
ncbi:MAG: exodeoxyribonuclease VII large subunit [Synergistaceae bacterium]|jgi:exodeoxyribonuclease VII large subunit|nr:exodeoxyribonuclease VII large subunit [Synergistaceae bacterium]